ncbi:hypothetical protein L7F22_036648 [Adiantum nelumboides]|nr:hypothetical protein [Adiantum nelumboides]
MIRKRGRAAAEEDELEAQRRRTPFVHCSFQDLGLCETLCAHMHERMGFSAPTHIQQAAIPSILSDRDVLVNAETGTGKTIVYLAPIVHKLQANMKKISRSDGTYALVLVPTRELCLQVYEVVKQLVHRFQWLVPGHVMGGESRMKEKARLRKGITILVATPGRLLDHLQNTSSFCYRNLQWIVFDEADRLLDLGFGKDIKSILSFLDSLTSKSQSSSRSRVRQHLLLSATLGDEVMELASLSLRSPAKIGLSEPLQQEKKSITGVLNKEDQVSAIMNDSQKHKAGRVTLEYSMPIQLGQNFTIVPCNLRLVSLLVVLHMWLDRSAGHKVVVFLSTCDSVDFHYALLTDFLWSFSPREQQDTDRGLFNCKCFRLHGNMSQQERTETFLEFNKVNSALLLCTDVAARGLDIPKVTHILQYDPPGDANAYVHRVGRTARLGQKGEALLFLQPCERDYLTELQKHSVTLQEASMKEIASDAFRSYVRAYTAHKGELKAIFQVKKLHLGHVAKSFGLADRPSLLGKSLSKKKSREAKAKAKGKHFKRTKKQQQLLKPAQME